MTTATPERETENPYLNGNYAPVREEMTAFDLDVTGTIPEHLDGRYLRIGPNPIDDPDPARRRPAERERLAREIHDTLAQGFTSIVNLAQAVEPELDTDAAAAKRHVELIRTTARGKPRRGADDGG
jgi:Histidine kinase/Retinal pigment epithelial membrane protein